MRRSSLVPDKDTEQNDSGCNECGLHQSDLSFTEIDKRPHQATAAGAGEKRTGKIESADAMSDALAHSGDDEKTSHNGNRYVDKESPAPQRWRPDARPKERPSHTRDRPRAAGRPRRPATFVRRI